MLKALRRSEKIPTLYYIQDVTEVKMNMENEASLLISDLWTNGKVIVTALQMFESRSKYPFLRYPFLNISKKYLKKLSQMFTTFCANNIHKNYL